MIRVYKIEKQNYSKLKSLLEQDKYEKDSFAMVGYKLREGKSITGEDCYYLYISAEEEKIKKFDEKLKEIAKILEGEEEKKVKESIEREEEQAQQGFGNIFG